MDSSPAPRRGPKRVRLLYARRVSLFTALVALPGFLVSAILLWLEPWSLAAKATLVFFELFAWWLFAMALQEQATRPLQTLANVVAALREEDYSFRARNAVPEDALGELSLEVNALADMLSDQRIRAMEAIALLRRVVEEVETPLFTFSPSLVLQLVNSAGERLLQQPSVRLLGRTAAELGLEDCLTVDNGATLALPGSAQARWLVRRSSFRQKGVPHILVVLSDVSRVLREEERNAWQRLVRVLGHELNNSLTPIKSIAGSLNARVSGMKLSPEERQDFSRGLEIIETRTASLNRFLQAYRRLAQMPAPILRKTALAPLVTRVANLETRLAVTILGGPNVELTVDSDQLEQMLINLIRNAVEAAMDPAWAAPVPDGAPPTPHSAPEVMLSWRTTDRETVITIEDNGPGLLSPDNLFTPFYTTKVSGTGVGLVLSRQIAEAHSGLVELSNHPSQRGCVATIVLPRTI
jgi:two-component system, NtrC family, nitrogen regulation sensor histidine kinase NtrY